MPSLHAVLLPQGVHPSALSNGDGAGAACTGLGWVGCQLAGRQPLSLHGQRCKQLCTSRSKATRQHGWAGLWRHGTWKYKKHFPTCVQHDVCPTAFSARRRHRIAWRRALVLLRRRQRRHSPSGPLQTAERRLLCPSCCCCCCCHATSSRRPQAKASHWLRACCRPQPERQLQQQAAIILRHRHAHRARPRCHAPCVAQPQAAGGAWGQEQLDVAAAALHAHAAGVVVQLDLRLSRQEIGRLVWLHC